MAMENVQALTSTRRMLLKRGGQALSLAGLGALVGASRIDFARAAENPAQDVQLLNAAIDLEHEGIAAYAIAVESELLQPEVAQIASLFRGHHERHRDELASAVSALGGRAHEPRSLEEYASGLNAAALHDQNGVLRLALGLERGAANAYLGLIPSLGVDYHQVAARMAGDEAFHAAILGNALGEPIPQDGLIFGG